MKPKKTIRPEHKKQHAKNTIRSIKRHWQLYLIVALPLVYLIVFKYMPIIGSQIAFRDYNFKGGIWHSPFVGLKYFKMFFQSPQFWRLMGNTLGLSVYGIVLGVFPPIILAIALNYVRVRWFGRQFAALCRELAVYDSQLLELLLQGCAAGEVFVRVVQNPKIPLEKKGALLSQLKPRIGLV